MSEEWATRFPLSHAACSVDPARLQELLSALPSGCPSLNALDGEGRAPLHYAAWNGLVQPALLLLEAGARVDVRSGDRGSTPLHLAAGMTHTPVVQLLLAHGADPAAVDADRWTPLNLAQQNLFGNAAAAAAVARALNEWGALLDGAAGGLTPAEAAEADGCREAGTVLRAWENVAPGAGGGALVAAAQAGNGRPTVKAAAVERLLESAGVARS
jgi:hypothetical protein